MNQTQVAKVVHQATGALDETTGGAAQTKWEELSDHDRSEKTGEVAQHVSGARRNVDPELVAKNLPEQSRLKYFLTQGIVHAFDRHEKALAGGNSLEHTASEQAQLQQTTSADTVNARNAAARAAAPPSGDSASVKDAMAKAEQAMAQANAPTHPETDQPDDHPATDEQKHDEQSHQAASH